MSDGTPAIVPVFVPAAIPHAAYELREEVTRLLAESGPDSFATGITPEGKVLAWMDNRSFEVLETRHGIVLRPLVDGKHKRRRR